MSRRVVARGWAALLLVLVVLTLASYRKPLTLSRAGYNLYGVRLDHGALQLFAGRHFSEFAGGQVVRTFDWREPDALETAMATFFDVAAERFGSRSWPLFAESFPFVSTTAQEKPGGAAEQFTRQIDVRAASAWLLLAVLTLPLVLALRHLGFRQPAAGSCPSCGYDLRASRERCPECGANIVTAASSS